MMQPFSNSRYKETFFVTALASILLLLLAWPAFWYFFFGENFIQLRVWNQHGRHLWPAAFSRLDGMFFRPGLFLASISWDFILPPNPVVYHLRNFVFCTLNIFLLCRILLKFVRSRPARLLAISLLAVSKIFLTLIGYINLYESSVLLMATLLTVLFWFRYIEERRKLDYILTLFFFALTTYCKDQGFVVIGVLAAMSLGLALKQGDVRRQFLYWFVRFVPLVIVSLSYICLRYVLTGPINHDNPIYSPQLSLSVAGWQAIGFLATLGNFSVTETGSMGERGLSFLLSPNSQVLEYVLIAALWIMIVYTCWLARGSWRKLIVPLVWIGLYLGPVFLVRNHQLYYYQEPLVGLVLLIGISLEHASRRLLMTWGVIVILIATNGLISNRRSVYHWQFVADHAEIVKPLVAARTSDPPKSIVFLSQPARLEFWTYVLRDPLVPHLLGSPNTTTKVVDEATVGYDKNSGTHDRPSSKGVIFFDLEARSIVPSRSTQILDPGIIASSGQNPNGVMFRAEPNPIQVCDGTKLGATTLFFSFVAPDLTEIHLHSPDGVLFATNAASGSALTGKWVTDGTVFFLQDVSGGKPLVAENTLATVKVNLTKAGCPSS
ncbi:MAG TPA: hypothetical protein VMS31_19705 [Pyrinomonadaceae bacterium]|nr:hypothetical protein [Pyrinomonadaceae bacterium]